MDKRIELIIKELNCLEDEGKTLDVLKYYNYIDDEENESYKISDLLSCSNSCVLTKFINNINKNKIGCISIANGIQTISFIFKDVVYKVTACDLDYINSFIDYCNMNYEKKDLITKTKILNPSLLICPVKYVTRITDGVYIYEQELIDTKKGKNLFNDNYDYDFLNRSLVANMENFYKNKKDIELTIKIFEEYYKDFLEEYSDDISKDIHNENWGFNQKGQPVIFDPFYFYMYD